jgi:hypothetical protein
LDFEIRLVTDWQYFSSKSPERTFRVDGKIRLHSTFRSRAAGPRHIAKIAAPDPRIACPGQRSADAILSTGWNQMRIITDLVIKKVFVRI